MQIHDIKRKTKNKTSTQVGRGGKRGKTSGRGTKGQKARAGHKIRPEMRDVIKRLPKLRGRGKNSLKGFQERAYPVNLSLIESSYKVGETVSPRTLVDRGIAEKRNGNYPRIKVLAMGEIGIKVVVSGCEISASAKEKIEKAGGEVKA